MTTNGLLVLIGILSIARGVFLLFPQMQVRAVWFKLILVICVGVLAWYVMNAPGLVPAEVSDNPPAPPVRYVVVLLVALVGILMLPSGEDPQQRGAPPPPDARSSDAVAPLDPHTAGAATAYSLPPSETNSGPQPADPRAYASGELPLPAGVEPSMRETSPQPAYEQSLHLAHESTHEPAPRRGILEDMSASVRRVWRDDQKKTMLEYMDSIIIAGVTALFLIWYIVRSFYIPSESMVPTLKVNDMILVDEVAYRLYRPARNDIVVFHPPDRANSQGKDFIKRIIAVEGDTVQVKNYVTYVNGQPVEEPFRNQEPSEYESPLVKNYDPITIPPGQVFCMGDNRANSEDSRFWGTLPVENIIGKAFLIFYPPQRIRLLH